MKSVFAALALTFTTIALATAQPARFEWIRQIGASGDDSPTQLAQDASSNLYVCGRFYGQLVFGTDTLNNGSTSNPSWFIAKYDSSGQAQWGRVLPLANANHPLAVQRLRVSQSGKLYVVGGTTNPLSIHKEYLAVYRPNGTLVRYANTVDSNTHYDVAFDSVDNVYLTGNRYYYNGIEKMYLMKTDSSGAVAWANYFNQESHAANVRYQNGNVYATGQFHYQLQLTDAQATTPITFTSALGINDWDFVAAVYSKTGKLVTGASNPGLSNSAAGPFLIASDITISGSWRIGTVGSTATTINYNLPSLTVTDSGSIPLGCSFAPVPVLKSSRFSKQTVFEYTDLVCYSPNVYVLDSADAVVRSHAVPFAGPGSLNSVRDYSLSSTGQLYVVSNFKGTINYSDRTGGHSLSSVSGSEDIYLAKYHQCQRYNPTITQQHDSVVCNIAGMSYQWLNNGLAVGSNSPVYIPTISGSIRVVVTDAWGCSDTSTALTVTIGTNGVYTPHTENGISTYPNPVANGLTIDGLSAGERISINDFTGRIVYAHVATNAKEQLNLSSLAPGLYFLSVRGVQIKVIKQ